MKSSRILYSAFVFLLFLVSIRCTKPQSDESEEANEPIAYDIKIELRVNTDSIQKPNIEPHCSFRNQASNVSDMDFTTEVRPGYRILWLGQSISNLDDEVKITQINYRGGDNLLNTNVINGDNTGVATGVIIDSAIVDQEEKYAISFKIILADGTQKNGTYIIDPKLKVIR